MTRISKSLVAALLIVAPGMSAGVARAQTASGAANGVATGYGMGMGMGMGYGLGMGMGNFRYAPSPTDYLNQRSSRNSSRPPNAGPQAPTGRSPNAYYNRVRDDGISAGYETSALHSPARQKHAPALASERGAHAQANDPLKAASKPKQVAPLTDFFNPTEKVQWPAGSPGEGGFKEKRDSFEHASLAVLRESREKGAASAGSVAAARQKLLDYGRPALQEVRANSSAEAADTFHRYLRSLYDSLGSTASPNAASGSAPKP